MVAADQVTVDRRTAVRLQLEAAIRHWYAGDWICCITLAGAAEEACPSVETEQRAFQVLRTLGGNLGHDPNAVGRAENTARNWLKHCDPTKPATLTVTQKDARFAIVRAVSAYDLAFHPGPHESAEITRFCNEVRAFHGVPPL